MRELVGIAYRLHEQQYRLRVRVVDQQIGEFADAQVGLVADRNELREADAAPKTTREQATEHAAALRDDREGAYLDLGHFEHGIDRDRTAGIGAHETDAIRPDDAYAA